MMAAPCSKRRTAAALLVFLHVIPKSCALSVIKVCQNKDCCRNFKGKSSLVQVLQDVTDENGRFDDPSNGFTVQSTGCLSKCDQGPNVSLDDEIRNGIQTPLHAVALIPSASNKLINAVLLMEKAQAASSMVDRLALLSKVVTALEADEHLRHGSARVHAQMLRARTHLSSTPCDCLAALEDVRALLSLPRDETAQSGETVGRLRRMEAEALEGLGRYEEAAHAWQVVAKSDLQFAVKAKNEVTRLMLLHEQQQASASG